MAESAGKIFSAIPAIMGEIGAVGKGKVNKTQGFAYRGIDDVMNAINPALVNNKVFIVPEVIEQKREDRASKNGGSLIYSVCKMRFRFYAEDGSSVDVVTIGEGMDSGDKSTNKAMAIAFKYACFQIFCIPTEEMKDPDADSHVTEPPKQQPQQPRQDNNRPPQQPAQNRTTAYQNADDAKKNAEMIQKANASEVDVPKINTLIATIKKKGVSQRSVLANYGVSAFGLMTMEQWSNAMESLSKFPDIKTAEQKVG